MKAVWIVLLISLVSPAAFAAKDDVNPADLVMKASELLQDAQALCEKGEYDKGIEKYEEALSKYNDAVKAYKAAKDKKSANNLEEKIKSVKGERDACKKNRREAEKAEKEKEKKDKKDKEKNSGKDG